MSMTILLLDLGRERRGGQRQSLLLARALAERGHRLAVAARDGSPLAADVAGAGDLLALFTVRGRGEADPRTLLDVARAIRRHAPEILYANDAHGHGAAVWSGAARSRALIVHRRVVFPPRGRWPSRLKYRSVHRFLAVSRAVVESLMRAGVDPAKISIVPDGLPDQAFVEPRAPLPPPIRLVHVGAFDGAKGQLTVVRAVEALSRRGLEVEASFLGEGPERAPVAALAERLGVAGRCVFRGQVDDVSRQLSRAHLFVLPSESEGASTALVEAMAAGCPAIVHDVGGAGEIVREADAGRALPTLDPKVWAQAVEEAVGAPDRIARWREAGRLFAEGRRIGRIVEMLESEIRKALACGA